MCTAKSYARAGKNRFFYGILHEMVILFQLRVTNEHHVRCDNLIFNILSVNFVCSSHFPLTNLRIHVLTRSDDDDTSDTA